MQVFVKALKVRIKEVIINTKYEWLKNVDGILSKFDDVKC